MYFFSGCFQHYSLASFGIRLWIFEQLFQVEQTVARCFEVNRNEDSMSERNSVYFHVYRLWILISCTVYVSFLSIFYGMILYITGLIRQAEFIKFQKFLSAFSLWTFLKIQFNVESSKLSISAPQHCYLERVCKPLYRFTSPLRN